MICNNTPIFSYSKQWIFSHYYFHFVPLLFSLAHAASTALGNALVNDGGDV